MRTPSCRTVLFAMLLFAGTRASASGDPCRIVIAPRPGFRLAAAERMAGLTPLGPLDASLPGRLSDVSIASAPDSITAARVVDALSRDPSVEWAEAEQARETLVWEHAPVPMPVRESGPGTARFPSDPLFVDTRQWGLANAGESGAYGGVAGADIHARAAWARTTGANDVRLALIDTGIDIAHPDLAARLADGSPRIVDAADLSGDALPVMADSFGHGTLVAGVMAALTNDGAHFDSLGVAGVCGGRGGAEVGCRLIPIRVTRGRGNTAGSIEIARAILYAAAHGARAVNLSMAGTSPSRLERLALAEALAHGTVVVAAAGNRGFANGGLPMYPAAHAAEGLCIQVGASDPWDQRALFSSYGPGLDVLAPGTDIWTTFMTYPSAAGANWGGYAVAGGTSLAAPFATGTIGLLCAVRPDLVDTDFQQLLRASADDLDPPGPDAQTGCGRLNAARALDLVGEDARLAHVNVAAQAWSRMEIDTLTLAEAGVPILDALAREALAERWEVSARIVIPDSIADACRTWLRVTGTTTLADGFHFPWLTPHATVSRTGRRVFTVRGSVYRLIDPRLSDSTGVPRELLADSAAHWIPAPPERMTFAVTLLGAARSDRASPPPRPIPELTIRVERGGVRIAGPPGESVELFDITGRRVAVAVLSNRGTTLWDPSGTASGVLIARVPGGRAVRFVRLR